MRTYNIWRVLLHSLIIGTALLLSLTSTKAQGISSVRINEVVVDNTAGAINPYGEHVGWIELYNAGAATVNVKGCYLTDDLKNLTKYRIPMTDARTILPPYRQLLFWADNVAARGALHLNFVLTPGAEQTIALVDTDGKTIIDQVTVPATLPQNASWARIPDGVLESVNSNVWQQADQPTPSSNNTMPEVNEKVERIKVEDPTGGIMTITAMLVVFSGLLLLALCFTAIGRIAMRLSARNKARAEGVKPAVKTSKGSVEEETFVAISMALIEATEEVHDEESGVLTIERNEASSSAWSMKAHNQRIAVQRNPFSKRS
ncbi:OadG family transporter subunit [Porphyromonas circumdentaria]|uniref:Oxaloacetate decarboxylase, gamma chain n=1 Tax=Porphyromonas circumdentaria TaxID=29524 RepID=A0A1T4L194_9PORP|nr:OadG family transporter subunit [Porphyromonas circumdentaria]MBB6275181.1 Na+-transporting methylmalonyl-CoA/oxaloacetate decarboxylase gamma subunit [Porphyromonas circumdentaria]MDO4721811.1 OadG family transporter subunit [Porphyromonas circumdentaria]SJZ48479.1 Oxaloacetate decarboxylase, gamma chain [Porphyromonas circumdentaria]